MHKTDSTGVIRRVRQKWLYLPVIATSFLVSIQPAFATIDNTATASGTYNTNTVTSSPSNTVQIPVVAAAPTLSVTKSVSAVATVASGSNTSITDAGDTITYQYVVTNTGNVTINAAAPVDAGPSFGPDQNAGTGTLSAFTPTTADLAPGQSQTYTAVYTLSQVDVDRAAGQTVAEDAVNNSATATGAPVIGTLGTVTASTASTTISGSPLLAISKTGVLSKASGNTVSGEAQVGDTINYTYTVSNTGNVAITDVSISDNHEGTTITAPTITDETLSSEGPMGTPASTDTVADNGIWSVLQPGATVTFTYAHTVTQAEVNGG